jgi:hypothetical protein
MKGASNVLVLHGISASLMSAWWAHGMENMLPQYRAVDGATVHDWGVAKYTRCFTVCPRKKSTGVPAYITTDTTTDGCQGTYSQFQRQRSNKSRT